MNTFLRPLLFCLCLALWMTAPLAAQTVPSLPCVVTVKPNDRRIWVQDRMPNNTLGAQYPLVIKGVNWEPVTAGVDPSANPSAFQTEAAKWAPTDIPLMAQMGVNVIRVYHDFGTTTQATQILDLCYLYNIKVIMTVDSPSYNSINDTANITAVVNAYKNHPAILMWAVGNEWDLPAKPGSSEVYYGSYSTVYAAADQIDKNCLAVKALDSSHLVTTFCIDPQSPIDPLNPANPIHYLDTTTAPFASGPFFSTIVSSHAPDIDVWALDLYRGASFQDVFTQWAQISGKPMFIGEFGADAYNHSKAGGAGEDDAMQSTFDLGLLDEPQSDLAAEHTDGICSGMLVFEFSDEWWKNGAPAVHNVSTEINYGQPDFYNDEEWFGLTDVYHNPRTAYYSLQARFAPGGDYLIPYATNPVLTTSSQGMGGSAIFTINGKTVYSRAGGANGARGFNVAVLDTSRGIRMSDYKHFDTWYDQSLHAQLQSYLNGLPNGSIVLLAIADEGGLTNPGGQTLSAAASTISLLQSSAWGSTQINNVKYQYSWAMIAVKGQGKLTESTIAGSSMVSITANPSTLPIAPLAVPTPASGVGTTSATLYGLVNGYNLATTGITFKYGPTSSYTNTVSATPSSVTGNATTAVSATIGGLTPNTPYHFTVVASNGNGPNTVMDATFTTPAVTPAITGSASSVLSGWATLNGTANPNGVASTAYFKYGTTTNYGSTTPAINIGSGTSYLPVLYNLFGLAKGVTYHYQLVVNSGGNAVAGSDQTFTTPASSPPSWHSGQVSALINPSFNNMVDGARTGAADSARQQYWYKGTDNNIWCTYLNGSNWTQAKLSSDGNVNDWLTFGGQYNLLCYAGRDNQIWCVYWTGFQWATSQLGTVPGGTTIAGDLAIDNSWNTVYFRGTDNLLHCVCWNGKTWVYSTIGTNPTANLKGNLAVDENYHLVYYQGLDNNLWCYQWTGTQWVQNQLTTTSANVGGAISVDELGLTVYYRSSTDNSAGCVYWSGKAWIQETLGGSANINASATSFSDAAPYTSQYDTLYIDGNNQAEALWWTGSTWTHGMLGDGSSGLTGGLSLQPVYHWIFARRSDGNIIMFYYQ